MLDVRSELLKLLPEEQALIHVHYRNGEWEKMRDVIHRLHGVCCYCDVAQLKRAVHVLEVALSQLNIQLVPALLEKLDQEIHQLLHNEEERA